MANPLPLDSILRKDESTIAVTIGLDVLNELIKMADPQCPQQRVMRRVAQNAARAASMDNEDTTIINHRLAP